MSIAIISATIASVFVGSIVSNFVSLSLALSAAMDMIWLAQTVAIRSGVKHDASHRCKRQD